MELKLPLCDTLTITVIMMELGMCHFTWYIVYTLFGAWRISHLMEWLLGLRYKKKLGLIVCEEALIVLLSNSRYIDRPNGPLLGFSPPQNILYAAHMYYCVRDSFVILVRMGPAVSWVPFITLVPRAIFTFRECALRVVESP